MNFSKNELMMMIEVISREKDLPRSIVCEAVESGIVSAACKNIQDGKSIDEENGNIRAKINGETGEYQIFRVYKVVGDDEVENEDEITLSEAHKIDSKAEVGEEVEEVVTGVEISRIGAKAARSTISRKIREAERSKVVEKYSSLQGQLISGLVTRKESYFVILDVGGGVEAMLSQMMPNEDLRRGDRVRAILEKVEIGKGYQLLLSRVSPDFLTELFRIEVPEIGEGLIEIMGAAREPGLRSKIAVRSLEEGLDPVGACVGMRGSRVQSVTNELSGERVDIIVWSNDIAEFVMRALSPAEIGSIMVDEENQSVDVIVSEEEVSKAIGKNGQNIRLASKLTGWKINILTDAAAEEKQKEENLGFIQSLRESLNIDENTADILIQEGFITLEHIAYTERDELLEIEEFDDSLVDELRQRAQDVLFKKAISDSVTTLDEDILSLEGMTSEIAQTLAQGGVASLEDLADSSTDEITDIVQIESKFAGELIMLARGMMQTDLNDK